MLQSFLDEFCQGKGIDFGHSGAPVAPDVRGWDIEEGDAHEMAGVDKDSCDFVHSSSSLERMANPARDVARWWQILKTGGYLITSVADRALFEKKKTLRSRFSADRKHYFLLDRDDPPDTIELIPFVQRACLGGEIVEIRQHTEGHTITDPYKQADGEFLDKVIVRKLDPA